MAPPTNDNWDNARTIAPEGGNYTVNTVDATLETGETTPWGAMGTVWYKWTAPRNGSTRIHTMSSVGDPDMAVTVFTGTTIANRVEVAFDDDSGNNPAVGDPAYGAANVTFSASAGTTYHIQVIGLDSTTWNRVTDAILTLVPPVVPVLGRWRFTDPETDEVYNFPINPNQMSIEARVVDVSWHWSHAHTIVGNSHTQMGWAGRQSGSLPVPFEFSGITLTQAQYETLISWTQKNNKIQVKDHLERLFTVRLQGFKSDSRASGKTNPWSRVYTISGTLFSQDGYADA